MQLACAIAVFVTHAQLKKKTNLYIVIIALDWAPHLMPTVYSSNQCIHELAEQTCTSNCDSPSDRAAPIPQEEPSCMEPPPQIVIDGHPLEREPSPAPYPLLSEEEAETTFVKLVRTLQYIKRWAGRAERPYDQKDAFLERFRITVPNIDDAYASEGAVGDIADGKMAVSTSQPKRHRWTFNPSGVWLYRWLAVVSLAVVFNTYFIILRTTFTEINESVLGLWMTLDYIADIIYLIDIFIQFRTSTLKRATTGLELLTMLL